MSLSKLIAKAQLSTIRNKQDLNNFCQKAQFVQTRSELFVTMKIQVAVFCVTV